MWNAFLAFAALHCLAPSIRAGSERLPEAPPQTVGFDAAKLEEAGAAVKRAVEAKEVPGAVVLVARRGKIVLAQAHGHRALVPEAEPMTRETVFDLASLTKPVATATSLMILWQEGKFRLDDPVTRHLPEFASNGKDAITIEQLLRHRSGLIADNPLADYRDGPEAAWHRLERLGLVHPPGERFLYSDVNYMILGRLVERLAGERLDAFAAERIFRPLGMGRTGFLPLESGMDAKEIAPTEPDEAGAMLRGSVHDPRARALGGVAGHAGLFGTADDLALYAQMLLDGGRVRQGDLVLAPPTVLAMTTPGETPPRQRRGLGWDIQTGYSAPRGRHFGPRSFGHTGFTGTSLWVDPDTETIVILLTSRLHPDGKLGSPTALRSRLATLVAEAIVDAPRPPEPPAVGAVKCGIDVLIDRGFEPLKGKRVGLITNHTGRARDGRSTIDVLHRAPGVELVALFSPEHGIRGAVDREVDDSRDEATGLPIYSLYGRTRKPTAESLSDLDVLVYDIQDIGARFYTYISTLGLAMEAAAEAKVPVVVLDRPNPIGGAAVGGPVRDEGFASFIAYHDIPVRHGMTVGELARMFNDERKIGADLTVIACEGWRREDLFDRTGLLWVNPSPNMRSLTEALLYPGVGLLESTNLATGRGTDTPFERLGAPWIDPVAFSNALNGLRLPGVRFVPITFTPSERQYAGQECRGVFVQITDRDAFDPIELALGLAATLRKLYPEEWRPEGFRNMLADQAVFEAIIQGKPSAEVRALMEREAGRFRTRRQAFLLYE